jgi:putative salt-induced outer membrane protein YdiY
MALLMTHRAVELSARSFAGFFRASRALNERLSAYGQYDFLRDLFAGVEQRHIAEGGLSYLAVDRAPHRLRLDGALGYLYENSPNDEHFDSATLSAAAHYRLAISTPSEFLFEPRVLLTLADAGAWKADAGTWKYEPLAVLNVTLTSILALKVSHTIRYAAEPPDDFENTDTITAISLVAKFSKPK